MLGQALEAVRVAEAAEPNERPAVSRTGPAVSRTATAARPADGGNRRPAIDGEHGVAR